MPHSCVYTVGAFEHRKRFLDFVPIECVVSCQYSHKSIIITSFTQLYSLTLSQSLYPCCVLINPRSLAHVSCLSFYLNISTLCALRFACMLAQLDRVLQCATVQANLNTGVSNFLSAVLLLGKHWKREAGTPHPHLIILYNFGYILHFMNFPSIIYMFQPSCLDKRWAKFCQILQHYLEVQSD